MQIKPRVNEISLQYEKRFWLKCRTLAECGLCTSSYRGLHLREETFNTTQMDVLHIFVYFEAYT